MIDDGATDAELKSTIESQMTVIFRIIGICLGIPPETFTWQYYDKSKKYNDVREITPLEFYTQGPNSIEEQIGFMFTYLARKKA